MVKYTKCCVLGCSHRSSYDDAKSISFFRLPKDKTYAKIWLQAIRREPANRLLVCEHHFESHFIIQGPMRMRLRAGAMPTRELPDPALVETQSRPWRRGRALLVHRAMQAPDEEEDMFSDNPPLVDIFVKEETVVGQKRSADEPSTSAVLDCPIKQEKPDDEAQTDSEMTPELDMLFKLSNDYLGSELAELVRVQVLLKQKIKAIGNDKSCNEELLLFALKLYNTYPQSYKLMFRALGLPSVSEVKEQLQPWEPDERWKRAVRARFEAATAEQRECVVCVARLALRPALRYDAARDRLLGRHELGGSQRPLGARAGLLLLARGVRARWRQPLACGLEGDRVDLPARYCWLNRVISSATEAGLDVRALVTDFDDNFFPLSRPVSPERPFLTLQDKRIFCFFDCTQLMVKLRDYLIKYDMNFGGLTASWEHLRKLHEWNSARAYKLAELTTEHVWPRAPGSARARASLAAETLSPRVAAALAAAVDLRVLDDSAHGTIQLITIISKLYEMLHAEVALRFECKKNNIQSTIMFLQQALGKLEKLYLVDKQTGSPVPEPGPGLADALRSATRATLALQRMRSARDPALPMRAFNNDPLHDFFDRLRALNRNQDPTGPQLLGAFRKNFAFHIMKSLKSESVSEKLGEFVQAAGEVRRLKLVGGGGGSAEWGVPRGLLEELLRGGWGGRGRKALERELLERSLQEQGCCAAAAGWARAAALPAAWRRLVETLERRFQAALRAPRPAAGLLARLLRDAAPDQLAAPCDCFPTPFFKTLFMHFRIRTLVRYNNNRWRQDSTKEFALNQLSKNRLEHRENIFSGLHEPNF